LVARNGEDNGAVLLWLRFSAGHQSVGSED